MEKHEKEALLEEAKRRYPFGTIYKDCQPNGKGEQTSLKNPHFINIGQGNGLGIDMGTGYVYYGGKWAEIVKKVCPFKIGDVLECLEDHLGGPKKGDICTVSEINTDGMKFKDRNSKHSNYGDFKLSTKVLIFNDIYVGDIVVSQKVTVRAPSRKVGDIFKVLDKSTKTELYYLETSCTNVVNASDWRKATPEEIEAYNKGIRNINDIPKKPSIPEYVECISSNDAPTNWTIGKIYKTTTTGILSDQGYNYRQSSYNDFINWISGWGVEFKPSTKEAYLGMLEKELLSLC